jgi:hypothetical protein
VLLSSPVVCAAPCLRLRCELRAWCVPYLQHIHTCNKCMTTGCTQPFNRPTTQPPAHERPARPPWAREARESDMFCFLFPYQVTIHRPSPAACCSGPVVPTTTKSGWQAARCLCRWAAGPVPLDQWAAGPLAGGPPGHRWTTAGPLGRWAAGSLHHRWTTAGPRQLGPCMTSWIAGPPLDRRWADGPLDHSDCWTTAPLPRFQNGCPVSFSDRVYLGHSGH